MNDPGAIDLGQRLSAWVRTSSLPYVGSIVVTVMLAGYATYLSQVSDAFQVTFKGQAMGIVIPFVAFPITVVLWLLYRGGPTHSRWVAAFLIGLSASWIIHRALMWLHGDLTTHHMLLFIPVVLMLLTKCPDSRDAWAALFLLAWLATIILVVTRSLEILGSLPMFDIPDKLATEWEKQNYWLPFSGYLGLDGRWPGPFGFNSKTGFVSVFLVVFGAARWTRSSWVFVTVGALGMVLTGGRGVYLAVLAGLVVLAFFAHRGPVARIPMAVRVGIAGALVFIAALAFYLSPISTTGRIGENGIWNSFLDLWRTSVWTGVGQTGIWASEGRAHDAMDAHSMYVQELAKFGVIGFVAMFAVLALGAGVAMSAAIRGWTGPLALLAIYFVAGVTDLLHDGWWAHSMYTMMVILSVLAAGGWLAEKRAGKAQVRNVNAPGRADESAHTPVT